MSKVILFGSRTRDDNSPRSDINLAVEGDDMLNFRFKMDEALPILLFVGVIDLSEKWNENLFAEVERDRVILYENIKKLLQSI